jgi:dihydroorotate dehydrogenase (NAD+) catalytic subunit
LVLASNVPRSSRPRLRHSSKILCYNCVMTLSTTVLGITFRNPILTAAGKWAWHADQLKQAAEGGAGGITTKSFGTMIRKGHPDPIVVEREHYTLNAVGLPSEGVDAVREDIGPFLADRPVPVLISVFAQTVDGFGEACAAFAAFGPDGLELCISCPNVQADHGTPFAYDPKAAAAATKAAKASAGGLPIFVKLSPNTPLLTEVAIACADAGADGITVLNTVGPGLAIDLQTRRPILSNTTGGMSGAAVKPLAVRCVADIYAATEGKLPIIGTGGVRSGEDAVELMLAGASLIGMGTAVLQEGYGALGRVAGEVEHWCEAHGVKHLEELIGAMHRG